MKFDDIQQFINVLESYLTHEAYASYAVDNGDAGTQIFESGGTVVVNYVLNLFKDVQSSIFSAFKLLYDDDTIPGEMGKGMNFIKINAFSEMFRDYHKFSRETNDFTPKLDYSYICECLFLALKALETAEIVQGGDYTAMGEVLKKYADLYDEFVPETGSDSN